jgi:hypothetical protein
MKRGGKKGRRRGEGDGGKPGRRRNKDKKGGGREIASSHLSFCRSLGLTHRKGVEGN